MSDRARNYVKGLSLPWHVKSLLFLIADFHNVKEGCAWPGLATLAELTGQDPRNVKRTIRAAEKTGKFRFVPGLGQGNKGKFYFAELDKEVPVTSFADSKAVTKAVTKEVISDSAIRNEPINHEPVSQNNTPNGALKFWLQFKDELKTELPEADHLWLRPLYLLKELSGKHLLLALPPNSRVMDAYKAQEQALRNRLGPLGYCCSMTAYPDEYTLDKLCDYNPEWIEVRDRLQRGKKQARSVSA